MKEELEQQLEHDFPFMQKSRVKEERNTYKIFGCECGDGWYGLIHELCQSITDRYVKEEILPENIDLLPIQIKEKFGILRYYYSFEDMPYKESVDDSKRNCVMILPISFIIIKRKACQYARTVGRVGN